MRYQIFAAIVVAVAGPHLHADQIHFGSVVITTPNTGYGIRTGKSLKLSNTDRDLHVRFFRLDELPKPNKPEVQAIMQRLDAGDVDISKIKTFQRQDINTTVADGTAKIEGAPRKFWLYAIPTEDVAIAAVAYASQTVKKSDEKELLDILRGLKSRDNRNFEFESSLGSRWAAQGKISAERKDPPVPFQIDDGVDEETSHPARSAVHLKAEAGSIFLTKAKRIPADWSSFENVSFWVYRNADQQDPVTIELQLYQPNKRTRHWRKVTIDHQDGWHKYEVPTRWMRWGDDGVPSWTSVDRLAFYFRDEGDIWIDSLAIEDADPDVGFHITAKDLDQIAFATSDQDSKVAETAHATVVTDAIDLELPKLVEHLTALAKEIEDDFSFLTATSDTPKLVVCSDKPAYQRFVTDFATVLNSQVRVPRAAGFTVHGVSSSYWDPKFGTLRPVYTHEFAHSVLARLMRLPNRGEWLQEGLASYYQLKFHPEDLADIVKRSVENRDVSAPLTQLCNGKPISRKRYWQAMTVAELLMTHEAYKPHLPEMLAAFQKSGSTNLEPHLDSVFNKTPSELTDDWRAHCRDQYLK